MTTIAIFILFFTPLVFIFAGRIVYLRSVKKVEKEFHITDYLKIGWFSLLFTILLFILLIFVLAQLVNIYGC